MKQEGYIDPRDGQTRYLASFGLWNGIALPTAERTIVHYLSEARHEVGFLGKWHLASTCGIPSGNVSYREVSLPVGRRRGYQDVWLASDILEFISHRYDGHMIEAGEVEPQILRWRPPEKG